jgi:uncharacterized protein (TIGR02145 family)
MKLTLSNGEHTMRTNNSHSQKGDNTMRSKLTHVRANSIRPLLAATFGLALAFTLSCSDDKDDGGDQSGGIVAGISSSSGSSSGTSSSSGIATSSSSLSSSSSQAIVPVVPVYGEPITDVRDGKTYETVVIGTQTWMAKNLDFETPAGSKCYNDNTINCVLYGRLYNWDAAMTACPDGWHLPSDMEWVVLEEFIGGEVEAAWKKLRATTYGSGTDDYGFSAIPSGGSIGNWWSSTESNTSVTHAYDRTAGGGIYTESKSNAYSVRCVKGNNSPSPSLSSPSYTPVSCPSIPANGFCDDRDGKAYKSVTIDGKTWMAENLNFNAEGSVCYDNDPANCTTYGRLYDWATVMAFEPACNKTADCRSYITENHKGICPKGWHVPNYSETDNLIEFAGGGSTAGQVLKATSGWTDLQGNPGGNGADLLGFSALPGGSALDVHALNVGYYYLYSSSGLAGSWWIAAHYDRSKASGFSMSGISSASGRSTRDKSSLISLRCVMD